MDGRTIYAMRVLPSRLEMTTSAAATRMATAKATHVTAAETTHTTTTKAAHVAKTTHGSKATKIAVIEIVGMMIVRMVIHVNTEERITVECPSPRTIIENSTQNQKQYDNAQHL